MDYGMIGKIEKAKIYSEERERFKFEEFAVLFEGDNNGHTVSIDQGVWHCDCEFFTLREVCSHTMALERLLRGMLPERVVA